MTEKKEEVLFAITKDNIWKVLTVVLAIALVFVLMKGGDDTPTAPVPTAPGAPAAPTVVDVSADDDPVKGDKDAPVEIIEFSDYECPFCEKFYSGALPQIEEQYIKTGKVKLIYRDLPLPMHPNAPKAAEAANCAREQGGDEGYYEFHDKLFANYRTLSVDNLKQYAADEGLDTGAFNECLDSGKYADEVKKDMADGQAAGVSGTPSFFINGIKLVGAQPFSQFQPIIEAELAK